MNDKFLHITNSSNNQYPSADIPEDIAWAEMRKLLDEDDDTVLPPPPPPMPPNGNGYWKYGLLLLLILITGIAVYVISNKTQSVQTAKHEENIAKQKVNAQSKNIAQSLNNDSLEKNNSNNTVDTLVTNRQANKTSSTDELIEKSIPPVDKNNSTPASENFIPKNNKRTTGSHTKVKTNGGEVDENNDGIAATELTGNNKNINNPKKIPGKGAVIISAGTKSKTPQPVNNNDQNIAESDVNIDEEKNVKPLNSTPAATNTPAVVQDTSTVNNADTLKKQMANTSKPGDNKTDTTPASNNKKNKKIALAAGLGLNQFFTVGGQQHSNYNSSGTVGAISDYIPVPFVRMYFNKKLYLQVELQFNTPQYTKQLLAKTETVSDTSGPVPVDNQITTYINKLFYFNVPLSIHYSPFNNFYIGAGTQFSQLTNGVGLFETRRYTSSGTDSLLKTNYAGIKNDSVYKEIKTNEWRVLVDANYQWKNLVFGLRYNQALSNFINVQISSTEITQARNSSLQLYLRYILWKNKPAKALFPK